MSSMVLTRVVKRSIYSNRTVTVKCWPASFIFHAIAYLLNIVIWLSECTFLQHMTSYNYIHRVYGYCISMLYTQRPSLHIIHVIHSIHVQLCMIFCLRCCVACWMFLLERVFSSVLLNVQARCRWELYMQ